VRGPENIRRSIVSAGGPQLDGVHLPVTDGLIDRLTDTRLYSGIHKERFDDAGRGRGKEGRDAPALGTGTVDQYGGGTVSDLSQIIRPTFRGGTHMNNHARAAALSPGGHPSSAGASAASSSSPFSPSGGGGAYTGPGGAHLLLASPQRGSGGFGGPGSPRSSSTLEGFPAGTPLRAAAAASAASSASAYAASPLSSSMTPSRQQLNPSPGAGSDTSTTVRPATAPSIRSPQRNERPMLRGGDPAAVASPAPRVVIESAELQAIFMAYCAFGTTARMLEELDSARFAKLCRESGVSDGRLVTPASVDVVFARLKKKGKRTITYPEFQQALAVRRVGFEGGRGGGRRRGGGGRGLRLASARTHTDAHTRTHTITYFLPPQSLLNRSPLRRCGTPTWTSSRACRVLWSASSSRAGRLSRRVRGRTRRPGPSSTS
jgi:hypothetical protein